MTIHLARRAVAAAAFAAAAFAAATFAAASATAGAAPCCGAAPVPAMVWDSVAIGGGGFVAALLPSGGAHPLTYARTDVGGAYRLDAEQRRWVPLLDWVSDAQTGLLGVDSLAIDPHDSANIYLMAGIAYLNGGRTAILHSTDAGKTFSSVDVSAQFKAHGNGMGRQNGERLAVDPGDGRRVYAGTRRDGLFVSDDAARTWRRVAGLAVTTTPNDVGIDLVLPDPSSVTDGRARRLLIGVSRFGSVGSNLYRSDDGGRSFAPVKGAPALMPQRAAFDGAGNLFITYANGAGPHPNRDGSEPMDRGQVWKYRLADGAWTEVTPAGWGAHAFSGIAVDPSDPRRLVLSTISTYLAQGDAKGDRIFVSHDGGASWVDVVARGFVRDNGGVDWLQGHAIHWASTVAFDPSDARAVWVTSGNGVFRAADIEATPTVWRFTVAGLEETVPLGAASLPGGALVSAIGDYDGFRHLDPARYGPIHRPEIGTTTGLAVAGAQPNRLVRVGDRMQLSDDGGATWRATAAPAGKKGQVAISSDGATILHSPEGMEGVWRSVDAGAHWSRVAGLPGARLRPVADPVDPKAFYAYDGAHLMASSDGGASFAPRAALPAGGSNLIRLAPGRAGDIWVALKEGGLVRSTDGGAHFARLDGLSWCGAVGFGKAAPGHAAPALYVWGALAGTSGLHGVYRSIDAGASWQRINDDAHQYGGPGDGQFIVGDMNRFGVVYMSTAGRGIVYGRPAQ
ncbi:xyloglucanase [Massilia sp. 9096]|uniref:WD40/YVTN/BNR-like repeat-containing protein n=1 Tax=Massilia sp. 9096 TaxID=1500894 RepID=UPI00069003D7|nr:xyloglucanase [Massilia sp. 9096]